MNCRTFVAASLLSILALTCEGPSIMHAADANATEPGPSDKDAPEEFTATKSGLKYRVLRKSDGDKPSASDKVRVNYKGWLDGGAKFDSSYDPGRTPIEFPLGGVIAGWTEGMQLVGEGGMIELEIPHQLGYGEAGRPPVIPGKSTLHFIVELIKVIPGPKPVEPGAVDKDAPEKFTTTESGLKYRIRRKSDGVKPTAESTVVVHYKGWLDNGKQFDSSYSRGESIEFPLDGVIPGWTEGMQLVGKGGMIELEVPSELGYGKRGTPGIPPNATLHFLVELIDVVAGPEPIEPGAIDKDAPKDFTSTKSGLKYRILRKSDDKKPTARSTVEVHYKGWLDNGKEFDSSYSRGESIEFPLNGVIPAWTEGMQLVGKGGMIELEVPAELGYGKRGTQGIPPNSTLHFIVELIDIK